MFTIPYSVRRLVVVKKLSSKEARAAGRREGVPYFKMASERGYRRAPAQRRARISAVICNSFSFTDPFYYVAFSDITERIYITCIKSSSWLYTIISNY